MTQTKAQLIDGKAASIEFNTGNASTPTITFTGDENTGIYSPGADQLAISTNGTGRLFVDSNGRIGINGNVAASAVLKFTQLLNADNGGIEITSVDGNGAVISRLNDGGLTFRNGGSERLRITSDGKLGLGTSSPGSKLTVDINYRAAPSATGSTTQTNAAFQIAATSETNTKLFAGIDTSSRGWFQVQNSSDGGTSDILLNPIGGNVGVGTTSPNTILEASTSVDTTGAIRITNPNSGTGANASFVAHNGTFNAAFGIGGTNYTPYAAIRPNAAFIYCNQANGIGLTADNANGFINFVTGGSTERARIDSSGRLLVGTSSTSAICTAVYQGSPGFPNGTGDIRLNLGQTPANGTYLGLLYFTTNSGSDVGAIIGGARDGGTWTSGSSHPTRLVFSTTADGVSSPTERMRIRNDGFVLIGKTTVDTSASGFEFRATSADEHFVVTNTRSSGGEALLLNRQASDGTLITFSQASVVEGSISVSGTTVSYNGAHLSRWSQLPNGAQRTEILRGSVLSNIDEMCEWNEEENEQLNRMKVSDVEGDKNVAGVFQAWDDDDIYTNDFYCAMTGDFVIRIGAGVTVERGDLLMSAGDGTAKPQGDGFVQDKTIAKVTSTHVTCTYDDGSYCVPCVLMAC